MKIDPTSLGEFFAKAHASAPGETPDDRSQLRDNSPGKSSVFWLLAIFVALWLIASLTSDGFLDDDAWTHFFYARFCTVRPAFLLDVWGRPICTGLFALAAPWAGMAGCRVIGILLVMACLSLTMRTARALQIDDRLSAIFLLGQPMLFLHSLSVMTELPFAVLLIAAFLAYLRRRWWIMALLVGLLPLARPEGFGFLLAGLAALLVYRKFPPIVLLVLPLIAWSFLGWRMWGSPADERWWMWLIDRWPYSASSSYGHGFLLQFVMRMPILVGFSLPFILFALFDVRRSMFDVRRSSAATENTNAKHFRLLLAVIPLSMLVIHSLLWWAGKMSSYGEIRYLLIASPFWAMLAALGWERAAIKVSPMKLAVTGLLIVFAFKVTILRASDEAVVARHVRDWYALSPSLPTRYRRVIASHPAMYAYLNISPADTTHYATWSPAALQHPADDAIVIWDPKCGPFNADNRLIADVAGLRALGWKTIETFNGGWVAMVKDDGEK